MKSQITFVLPLAMCLFMASAGPARAYLDPGTGSILLQMLLGGVAGGLVVIKLYWARIRSWFSPKSASGDGRTGSDSQGPGDR